MTLASEITWPEMPRHGEFVDLPLELPPGLLEATGYDGHARYVALWRCGDDVMVGDGTTSGTGRWYGFEVFWVHPLVRALLAPYQLEPPDHDPYLSAPHWLLADRWAQTLAVGEHADVEAFLRCQPNALASLAEGLDDDQLTRVVRASLANRPVVDVAELQRDVATATGHRLRVQVWLDARLGEIEGRGRSSGPAPLA